MPCSVYCGPRHATATARPERKVLNASIISRPSSPPSGSRARQRYFELPRAGVSAQIGTGGGRQGALCAQPGHVPVILPFAHRNRPDPQGLAAHRIAQHPPCMNHLAGRQSNPGCTAAVMAMPGVSPRPAAPSRTSIRYKYNIETRGTTWIRLTACGTTRAP